MTFCPYCGNQLQFSQAEICPKCGMRIKEGPAVRPDSQFSEPYSGFWTRFGAYLIDFVILIIIATGVYIILMASYPGYYGGLSPEGYNLFVILFLLIYWLYFTLQESSDFQATIGKRAVKIKVVNSDGNKITFGQAAIRNFLRVIPLIGFICVLSIGFSEKKQGFHDMAATTYVVPN
jgi:uncharacterized RDD family membrane protein YckC